MRERPLGRIVAVVLLISLGACSEEPLTDTLWLGEFKPRDTLHRVPDASVQRADAASEPETAPQQSAPTATPPMPAAGKFRVQLASMRTEQAALAEQEKLKTARPDLFDGLSLSVQRAELGSRGVFYRVQAGPFADGSAASQMCDKAKRQKLACFVVRS